MADEKESPGVHREKSRKKRRKGPLSAAGEEILQYMEKSVMEVIAREIAKAAGNEVFFVGNTDLGGKILQVEAVARGNDSAAPALLNRCLPHDVVIHNHPGGDLTPSDADLNVASRLGNSSVGFYILDNAVEALYVVVEPFPRSKEAPVTLDPKLVDLLEAGGPLAMNLPGFQHRPAQQEMARAVLTAFNDSSVLSVEAGTGTGKSYAYLIPALTWAAKTGERVVISTNTISLQEQLLTKDIPFVKKALGLDVPVELVKGRGNYVCKRKLGVVQAEADLHTDGLDRELFEDLIDWATTTRDGTTSDLNYVPRPDLWDKIVSEADTTLGVRCDHYQDCFFNSARRRAGKAKILLVNHHLLCADLALRLASGPGVSYGLLPSFDRVILDEAHHLEEVATGYFGSSVTRLGLFRLISKIYRDDRGGRGVLAQLRMKLVKGPIGFEPVLEHLEARVVPRVLALRMRLEEFFVDLCDLVRQWGKTTDDSGEGEIKMRLTDARVADPDFQDRVASHVRPLKAIALDLKRHVEDLLEDLDRVSAETEDSSTEAQRILIKAYTARLVTHVATVESVLGGELEENVCWIEARPWREGDYLLKLARSPIEVAEPLSKALFGAARTVVCTSATLTVQDRFDHFHQRSGVALVDPARRVEMRLPSPFDFPRQALLGIPQDMPDPSSPQFTLEAVMFLKDALLRSEGGAFVLTTSYRMLKTLARELSGPLRARGIECLVQGNAPRNKLLETFRSSPHSVLFGTSSFWEGVDVPGNRLRLVVLVKLPFAVPTEPVIEARSERIEKRGGSSFRDLLLPESVIRLRQGFGRLIRTETDRGAVLILDKRVVTKSYGRVFLDSLPPAKRVIDTSDRLLDELSDFTLPL